MSLRSWIARHRVGAAFAAGALLALAAVVIVHALILTDQRRSARLLAATLSRALGRPVEIDRVTELAHARLVLQDVRLPAAGGWPADIRADRVEATGPFLAAAAGAEAPVRVVVTGPRVEVPAGPAGASGLGALEGLREGLAGFLAGSPPLDVALTGGTVGGARAGPLAFDLSLRRARGSATAELVLRGAAGLPLVLAGDARLDGTTARLALTARGGLDAIAPWLPAGSRAATGPLALRVDLDVAPGSPGPGRPAPPSVAGRVVGSLGEALALEGDVVLKDGVLGLTVPRARVDLAAAGAAAGLAWRPTGRLDLGELSVTWRPEGTAPPAVSAVFRVADLRLPGPGAAVGADIVAIGVEGRLAAEPAGTRLSVRGDLQADRLTAAGVTAERPRARYRLGLGPGAALARADLDGLTARVAGLDLSGTAGYDGPARRLDARVEGQGPDAAPLIRRLAPGWLADGDRVRLPAIRLTAAGVDPVDLAAGTLEVEARGLALVRVDGEVASRRVRARVVLGASRLALSLDGEEVVGALPVLRGSLARVTASADLARSSAGVLELRSATGTARDALGQDLLTGALRLEAAGQRRLVARAPDLARLGDLWPELDRRLTGVAEADLVLGDAGLAAVDGRLTVTVPEAELLAGRVFVRDVAVELPVRRGGAAAGAPPWGRLRVGELIGYGLVVRDLATPARVWNERLRLDRLAYALYSGAGEGWAEAELDRAGLVVRGRIMGDRVRIEDVVSATGVRGATMTGLLRYAIDGQYQDGRIGITGRLEVPDGGVVNIELLNRLLAYAQADPTGVVRAALENLRNFDYKSAEASLRPSARGDDVRINLSLQGRERFGIFPPGVREINVQDMPLSFVTRRLSGG